VGETDARATGAPAVESAIAGLSVIVIASLYTSKAHLYGNKCFKNFFF
jgi:hypothetical protein